MSDAYRLRNLHPLKKVLASVSLVAGLLLFLLTSVESVLLVQWTSTGNLMFSGWGNHLAEVAWSHARVYTTLLLTHALGLALTLVSSLFLFRLTTVRARLRKAIQAIALFF